MNGELLRIIDTIHRDKAIDKEVIFQGIEQALQSATRKKGSLETGPTVQIDRLTGKIRAFEGDKEIDTAIFGRIAAQTAKQVIIQKIREAERDTVYVEFEAKKNDIVTGSVQRFDGPHLVVNIGKTEAILTRGEQVPGEAFKIGERLRAYVYHVEKKGTKIKIFLSRTHNDFVKRLFELEVPEIAEKSVEIRAIAREPGARTKVAVNSVTDRVDCVGACVGVRGSRIRNIVDELNGERVDIIRFSEESDEFIKNSLKPAEIADIEIDEASHRAKVMVVKDQLSLAIGKGGQNVRLAGKLTGWELDIVPAGGDEAAPAVAADAAPDAAASPSPDSGGGGADPGPGAGQAAPSDPAGSPAPSAPEEGAVEAGPAPESAGS